MFPHFFDPAGLGESLREVATDVINAGETEIIHRWFHSPKDADLFIWLDKGQNIIKQQITFYGQVVEWNIIEGVRTGVIVEDENRAAVKASDVIRFDARAQKAPIDQALDLLRHIATLNDLERHVLIKNFAQNPTSTSLDPEEFVRRYGAFLGARRTERVVVDGGQGKLRRLVGWILSLFGRQF